MFFGAAVILEITFAFFDFHRAFGVVIDYSIFTLGFTGQEQFLDDLFDSGRGGAHGSGAVGAAEGSHAAHHHLGLFERRERWIVLERDETFTSHDDFAFFREIERNDGYVFERNVLPDVELGPVGERKYANGLAFIYTRVVDIP
jgi:hypothetical protein